MRFSACVLLFAVTAGCAGPDQGPDRGYRMGSAKVNVTPLEPTPMSGYGSRKNDLAKGTEADLYVRAVSIEDAAGRKVVLLSADLIYFPPAYGRELKRLTEERFGLKEEDLILYGTHTHNGPKIRPPYSDWLRGKVLEAIGTALENRNPVELSIRRTRATFGVNRRVKREDGSWWFGDNPDGVTDPDVPVVVARSEDGNVKAVLFTYACHCTSIRNRHDGFWRYHGDYAGEAEALLEKEYPGAVALYVTGCGGDIDPSPRGPILHAKEHGKALAGIVSEAVGAEKARSVSGPLRTKVKRIDLPLEKPVRSQLEKAAGDTRSRHRGFAQGMLKKLDAGEKLHDSVDIPLQVWQFGEELTLIALPCEVTVEYALRLKKELGAERTWVTAYANEVPCYLPSERVLNEGGYEAGWDIKIGRGMAAWQMTRWPTPFAPGVEDLVIDAVVGLVRK